MYLLLFILWLILNGKITVEICLFGAGITAALGGLAYFLFGYTPKKDIRYLSKVPFFMWYICVLTWEILKANIAVIGIIWNSKRTVKQSLVVVETGLKTGFARFVMANSITLTPGTITVKAEGSKFVVHCLNREMIEGIEDGRLCRLLKKIEE